MSSITDLLNSLISGQTSAPELATTLARTIQSQSPVNLEPSLSSLWSELTNLASQSQEAQPKLIELLVLLSQQPAATDNNGNTTDLYGDTLWKDLPMFGWAINAIWNRRSIPDTQPARSQTISTFANSAHLVALLTHTKEPLFQPYRLQILWTFRPLEHPSPSPSTLEIEIPAIAAVTSVLGTEIREWRDEWPSTPTTGAPAKGGPLWVERGGTQGFDPARYDLWKERLGVLADMDGVGEEVRRLAREAERRL